MIKQTESQNLGRAGERWFQSILPKEWIFQKPEEDIGLDGKVFIGTTDRTGGYEFAVQIKSSRSWKIKNKRIFVDGVRSDTVLFWGSRMYPTLVILYDNEKNIGYYGWVFDIVSNPMVFAHPLRNVTPKTVRLEFLATKTLDKNSFDEISKTVDNFYIKYITSLHGLIKTVNLLPTINTLIFSIRGLFISHMEKQENEDGQRMLRILMVKNHISIVRVLDELQKKYQLEIGSRNFLNYFISSYIKQVNEIIHPFEKIVFEHKDLAVLINEEKMRSMTPMLIDMLLDFILTITDEKQSDRGSIFKFGATPV